LILKSTEKYASEVSDETETTYQGLLRHALQPYSHVARLLLSSVGEVHANSQIELRYDDSPNRKLNYQQQIEPIAEPVNWRRERNEQKMTIQITPKKGNFL